MKEKEIQELVKHCNRHFWQLNSVLLHAEGQEPHIDILRYPPNFLFPYWKLVTVGASDYAMPLTPHALGNRNEYVMFLEESLDLEDPEVFRWYAERLYLVASYAQQEKLHISCGHAVEWGEEDDSEMVAAFIEMPQVVLNTEFLHCKLGPMKNAVMLQVIPLTRPETEWLLEIGPEAFSYWLFPEDNGERHFLAQRYRTEQFNSPPDEDKL